jgi:hypothetical protein
MVDEGGVVSTRVEYRDGDWTLEIEYRVPRNGARVERRFTIGYHGPGEALLRHIDVAFPTLPAQADDLVELPVSGVPSSLPVQLLKDRILQLGGNGTRLAGLWSAKSKRTILCWAHSEDEFPTVKVTGTGEGVRVFYTVPLAARMKAGSAVAWGGDYVWRLDTDWFSALKHFQNWWKEAGITTPPDRPRWTERALLYETQIGAAVFDRGKYQFEPYPTMQSLIDNLDYIQKLGFNTLQIMPRHPSPSYAVDDYYNPARQFGDTPGIKELVQKAHQRGMRVILDWLVHGVIDQAIARKMSNMLMSVPEEAYQHRFMTDYVLNFAPYWMRQTPPESPLRLKHPEWFMKLEDGSLGHIYTWAFDLENPALQDYIIEAMKFYLREYDVDGFRVDAPDFNAFANWDRNIPYRASRSTTGAIRLFDRALPILRKAKTEVMMYTEPSSPVYRRMFDTNYAYDELWMFEQLLAWRSRLSRSAYAGALGPAQKPITAYQARLWLENRRRSMPPGIVTIHQVDSHDSFWWLPQGEKFRREQFGVEGARALLFMIGTMDGGMMHYPTGEQGSEAFMRRVLALREQVPEIKEGRCEYLKVRVSDESVFAVSWHSRTGIAIPLTNMGRAPVSVRVDLPPGESGLDGQARYSVREVFNGKPVGGLGNILVQLDPLESALIVIRKQ